MKKLLILLFIFMCSCLSAVCADYMIDEVSLRPAKTVSLPRGSFIKLTNLKEFSSQFVDKGDEVVMISTYDVYIGEAKIIPQNSKFYGYIEKINEPVQGTNATIVIKMTKFVTPEGITFNINGYLSDSSGNLFLGGGRAPAEYFVRMPHYTNWKFARWKIAPAQYCESNTRQFGQHTIVKPGAEIIMVLQDNFDLVQ